MASRELYTNADEFSYTVKRPIIINGIDEFVERNDLASRTMKVHIRPLRPTERATEGALKQQVREARPRILGGICKALAEGLKHLDDKAEQLPRMADFADFIDGAEAAFPSELPRLIDALKQLHDEMARERAEASAIVTAFKAALAASDSGRIEGDMTTWWKELKAYAGNGQAWPGNVWAFRSNLRRDQPVLQHMGIEVCSLDRKDPKTRRELYEAIRVKAEDDPSETSDPSSESKNGLQRPENGGFAAKDGRRITERSKDAAKDPSPHPSDKNGQDDLGNIVFEGSKDAKDPLTFVGEGVATERDRAAVSADLSSLIDFEDDDDQYF